MARISLTCCLLRTAFADRIYLGVDLSEIPAESAPVRVVTAKNLQDAKVRTLSKVNGFGKFGNEWLVHDGTVPEHVGQAVAILLFESAAALRDFNERKPALDLLRYGDRVPVRTEKDVRRLMDPLLAEVEREAEGYYGETHFIRIAGTQEDEFATSKDGRHDPTAVGPAVQDPAERERNRRARDAVDSI